MLLKNTLLDLLLQTNLIKTIGKDYFKLNLMNG